MRVINVINLKYFIGTLCGIGSLKSSYDKYATVALSDIKGHDCTHRNIFQILLNQTEIGLYLSFSG